jgi:small subunit ribosomal protein S2
MAPVVTMRQLLESGVHFGHQTRRWNPKMKRFILTERNGIYIIDLQQSLDFIDRAYEFIRETVAHGGSVLYVGTKKQAQEAIAEQARRVGMPFVNQRWLGGMLTNFSTVYKRLQRLKELEEIDFDDVAGSNLTKKELLHLRREREKLDRSLGGIRDMARVPSAIWVVDTKKEHIAVSEARKLGIPVIAILDTNCDPDEVSYPIPGNDDAIRSVALLTRVIADAVADGLIARAGAAAGEEKPAAADGALGTAEPLAEWERDLLEGKAAAEVTVNGTTVNGAATSGSASNGAASSGTVSNGAGNGTPASTSASGSAATGETATSEALAAPVPAAPAVAVSAGAVSAEAAPAGAAPTEAAPPAPPQPAADDSGTRPRPGSAEADSADPIAAEPDVIDPEDEVPTDEVPTDELPADELPADKVPVDEVPAASAESA